MRKLFDSDDSKFEVFLLRRKKTLSAVLTLVAMCSVLSMFSFMINLSSLAELVGLMGSVPSENAVLVILGLFLLLALYSMDAHFFVLADWIMTTIYVI